MPRGRKQYETYDNEAETFKNYVSRQIRIGVPP